ncbi:MAG: hypothetical protein KKE84_01190 [Gammaproteobacteria bacterium]|nr:hypothetical protein [Gammaproteobacteria bacterium]
MRPVEAEAELAAADTAEPRAGRFERLKRLLGRVRKPVAEQVAKPDQAARDEAPAEAEPAAADTAEPRVGRFERLKRLLGRVRKPVAEQAAEPDQVALDEVPAREQADENVMEEEASAPPRSWLARLKTTFRRQPGPEVIEADESIPDAKRSQDATAFSEDEADSDEDAVQPGRIRRALAALSNKWVWIPAASVMLLVLIGAMALMLLQSAKEKEHLQAELLATQKKLEQKGVSKAAAVKQDAGPADAPAFVAVGAVADSRSGIDAGDCQVSDKASVTQHLKNCIDSFNRISAGSPPARTVP